MRPAGGPGGLSAVPEPVRPTVARDAAAASVRGPAHRTGSGPDDLRGERGRAADRPAHPYRERALALWPGLDRVRLRRCGNDLGRVVRLVAQTTCEAADVIEAMLCARPETQVVMPPVRRSNPIPIDPYVVLPTRPHAVDEGEDEEDDSGITAPPPGRSVTSHDIPWVAATAFGGRDAERTGSA